MYKCYLGPDLDLSSTNTSSFHALNTTRRQASISYLQMGKQHREAKKLAPGHTAGARIGICRQVSGATLLTVRCICDPVGLFPVHLVAWTFFVPDNRDLRFPGSSCSFPMVEGGQVPSSHLSPGAHGGQPAGTTPGDLFLALWDKSSPCPLNRTWPREMPDLSRDRVTTRAFTWQAAGC